VQPRWRHAGGQPAQERQRVHVHRDRPVGVGLLEGDAHEAVRALLHGVGPSVVMVDEGMAKTTTTNTLKDDIYAFVFSQKGLMAGLGLQGNKIEKITPK
jgi:hypothetical protein